AESRLPARRQARQVGDALQAVAHGVAVSHGDGEGVVEAERRAPHEPEPLCVVARHGAIDAIAISDGRVLQHGRVRGPRVLHVQIYLARRDGLMTHERAAQVEAPLHGKRRAPLDLLCHDLTQQVGFGEVLGTHHDPVAMGAPREEQSDQAEPPSHRPTVRRSARHVARHANRRSATPKSPSAASAISAAGSAPARMSVSSTTATPRKMYTPSPPAPMPPMNGSGMRKPNRARLGTVWNTFATPSTGPRHAGRRVSRTPSGTPITIAAPVEIATRYRCCPTSPRTSCELRA